MSTELGYDRQTAKFLGTIAANMSPEITGADMQWWIQHPAAVRVLLEPFARSRDEGLASQKKLILPAEQVVRPAEFKAWKRLKLGVPNLQSGPDFIRALEQAGHKINDWARRMLLHSDFTVASAETEIDWVVVSVADLGFTKATRYDTICAAAKKRGLELCPAETGPQLRLQYLDQPLGEWLRVAMEPIRDSDGNLRVFFVGYDDGGRWLRSSCGGSDDLWNPGCVFVFRARKLSLAA